MKIFRAWIKVCIIVVSLGLVVISCNQDPIFFIISTETAPIPPMIPGSPTNMVVFHREYIDPNDGTPQKAPLLCVASGKLYWYGIPLGGGKSKWNLPEYSIPQPDGKIFSLAVTNDGTHDRLYALCLNGTSMNATLWYIEADGSAPWIPVGNGVGDYPYIQSIYSDPETDKLFACGRTGSGERYALLYRDDADNTLKLLKDDSGLLSGIACRGGTYYLSTRGNGIFESDGTTVTQLAGSAGRMFMGMIKLGDNNSIIVIERDGGTLYHVKNGWIEPTPTGLRTERYATGALALWEGKGRKMLIVGIQGSLYTSSSSSYTHGYVEFSLNSDGSLNHDLPRLERGNLWSVDGNTDRYASTIGKHPINHLYQTPIDIDPERIFFASTQTAGLWSYRNRINNGGWQWNAEADD